MRTLLILMLSIGFIRAADLTLPAIDGTQHTPLVAKDGKPILMIFVSSFCSTTKAFVAEINKIVPKPNLITKAASTKPRSNQAPASRYRS